MTSTLTGRLHALETNRDYFGASIYNDNGQPYWRTVSPEAYDALVHKYSDYLTWIDAQDGYEYRSYSVNAQIEADWQHEEAEVRDYRQTVDAVARENA